jgi:hypothetical protein
VQLLQRLEFVEPHPQLVKALQDFERQLAKNSGKWLKIAS